VAASRSRSPARPSAPAVRWPASLGVTRRAAPERGACGPRPHRRRARTTPCSDDRKSGRARRSEERRSWPRCPLATRWRARGRRQVAPPALELHRDDDAGGGPSVPRRPRQRALLAASGCQWAAPGCGPQPASARRRRRARSRRPSVVGLALGTLDGLDGERGDAAACSRRCSSGSVLDGLEGGERPGAGNDAATVCPHRSSVPRRRWRRARGMRAHRGLDLFGKIFSRPS